MWKKWGRIVRKFRRNFNIKCVHHLYGSKIWQDISSESEHFEVQHIIFVYGSVCVSECLPRIEIMNYIHHADSAAYEHLYNTINFLWQPFTECERMSILSKWILVRLFDSTVYIHHICIYTHTVAYYSLVAEEQNVFSIILWMNIVHIYLTDKSRF